MSIHRAWIVALLLAGPLSAAAAEKLQYNRDVRPILAENCFACHGPDSAARKADLRLDKRDMAIEMAAIEPGKPDASELVARITSADEKKLMPPPKTKKTLTAAQKDTLRRWIAEGAEYEPHWSLVPPKLPAVPKVKNAAWVKNPIDAFVLAKLEERGLAPAAEADRRTLARRVSFDLTGLPPAIEDVEAFVNDKDPNAYEKYVDKLLATQQWGEHRGRYWLDAARYADTHGIHFDNYREMYSYREWVIDAFNRNMPFDQFTVEQLAGDLLPNRTPAQQVASGFNRCNITTNEGGAIAEEYLVLYNRDRTETTATVWLGLTAGCAVCHNHKFDPLTQKQFYEMAAFFNNTTQSAMDGNIKDTPPIIPVASGADRERSAAIEKELPGLKQLVEERKQQARGDFDKWLASADAAALAKSLPTEGLYLHAPLAEGQGEATKIAVEGKERDVALAKNISWQPGPSGGYGIQVQGQAAEIADAADFEKDQAFCATAWIKLPPAETAGAICSRMDKDNKYRGWDFWVQRRQVGTHIINAWPENALKVVGKNQIPANEWTHVAVSYDGSGKTAGVKIYYNGALQENAVENDKLSATIKTTVPFKIGQRNNSDPLSAGQIHDLRIYKRALSAGEVETLAKVSRFSGLLAKPADQRTDAEKNELYNWYLSTNDAVYKERVAAVSKLEQEQAAIRGRGTIAYVMQERGDMPSAFVLNRGEYDKRKEPVKASTPDWLPKMADDLPRNRLGFAKWLLSPEQPTMARVTVNRFWNEVFGTGLVRTTGDFGVSGELPSHPELLDWLAVDFRDHGWDIKRFFKQIVMSNTYRQAATATPEKLEKDRDNRLLSRGPRFRMDGEMIRDAALASSGLLVKKIGGPSVKPYQPEGVWEAVAMIGSNTRDYKADSGENLYRRSLYTFWKRSAPPASMEIFNAPNRETCVVRRERTNTALQALVTLNDVQFVEAARNLAQAALKTGGDTDEAKINFITGRLVSRPFRIQEQAIVQTSLAALLAEYKASPEEAKKLIAVGESKADPSLDPATLAAWTMLVNELMNLDEVVCK
jgi:mono/diheme cytochrome c family protein